MINWDDYKKFSKWEFTCDYSGENRMQPHFMRTIQDIRNAFNKPMVINSGYRDFTHPLERAKEAPGEHYYGMAADVAVDGQDAMDLFVIAYGHGIRRLGVYQNDKQSFLHIGMGDKGLHFPATIWTP